MSHPTKNITATPLIEVVAAIIIKQHQVFIAKRAADKPFGGMWEFPGGKIETNEVPLQALKREIKEELDIDILEASLVQTTCDQNASPPVKLQFYLVDVYQGYPKGNEGQQVCWTDIEQLSSFHFPPANQSIIQWLLEHC
ncbi:MAG: (deoxy)nucleoside triphosphate pyrophosphohydrolase [Enterobacterales bacterium]|nr:(deoxy)nucleoside triphosphate pyrophosphohydrolase [Enterobacterales bacterium]